MDGMKWKGERDSENDFVFDSESFDSQFTFKGKAE